ncbi:MAG: hypothetical protein ACXWBS_06555 [Chthoniobacterales bacterium]
MPPKPRVLPPPPRVVSAPANYPGSGTQTGPKKETARISILPEPAARPAPTVKMTKTQPLMAAPEPKVHTAAVKVAEAPVETAEKTSFAALFDTLDSIPMPICWTIFGVSSITLLIQIWNYLSS